MSPYLLNSLKYVLLFSQVSRNPLPVRAHIELSYPGILCHSVEAVFNSLEKKISTIEFCLSFPLILTDRGSEFAHPDILECGVNNVIRTSIYYCDPMCSWQKPHCEKNHEYIRKICPKGTSFDSYTQYDIDRMMSHINSSPRESLGGLTPYALAEMMLSKTLMKALGLRKITPDEVNLTPDLLKK